MVRSKLEGARMSKIMLKVEALPKTIGLSVMATQASAITFLSTPGQAFNDGMGFVQFYFGVPLAMVIVCMVFIPIYHKLNVYTAYEFLERRFDVKQEASPQGYFCFKEVSLQELPYMHLPYLIGCTGMEFDLS